MPLLPGWGDLLRQLRASLFRKLRITDQRQVVDALPANPADAAGGYLGFAETLKKEGAHLFYADLDLNLRPGVGKPSYRRTHAAIMCLQVDGIVTTNFDWCLTDAQSSRFQRDPKFRGSRYGQHFEAGRLTNADENINAWLKYEGRYSFGGPTNSPLYLHGSLQTRDGIVITSSDYADFYGVEGSDALGTIFLEQLAGIASIIFVGYGFSDPFINNVLTTVAKRPVWNGDHFAIIGVKPDENPEDLNAKTKQLQNMRICPVYYPANDGEHSSLQTLLDALNAYNPALVNDIAAAGLPSGTAVASVPATRAPVVIASNAPIVENAAEWGKLPPIDAESHVERAALARQLDDLASNVRVRIICLWGLGGAGKTTLLRAILDDKSLADARYPDGVLVHPIRDEAQADAIVDALCHRFPPASALEHGDRPGRARHAETLLHQKRILLVLDGAELLQERPGLPQHGRFMSDDLRTLLLSVARAGQSLVAITTRFAPVEFRNYEETSYRAINLRGFMPEEAKALFRRLGVKGSESELAEAYKAFEGHPQGLALFAGVVAGPHAHISAGGVRRALGRLSHAASLDQRLTALLDWYRQQLSPSQAAVLTLLAVYPTYVSHSEIVALLRNGRVKAGDFVLSVDQGLGALMSLQRLSLIQFDDHQARYECHAIVRQVMGRTDPAAAEAAITSLTGDVPSFQPVATVEELQRVVDAIEIAVEVLGDFSQASLLIVRHLASGKRFLDLGVPHIGVACLGRLTTDDPGPKGRSRRQAAEAVIGNHSIGAYIAWMRDFHEWLGNYKEAERYRQLDGKYYLNLNEIESDGAVQFYIDGVNFAREVGDIEAVRRVRSEFRKRFGRTVSRLASTADFKNQKHLIRLLISFHNRDCDRERWISMPLISRALDFPDLDLLLLAMSKVRSDIGLYKPATYTLPSDVCAISRIRNEPRSLHDRIDRLARGELAAIFLAVARLSQAPDLGLLWNVTHVCCVMSEVRAEPDLVARAFLALAAHSERMRALNLAALATSWAAHFLIETLETDAALDCANRALDTCGESRLEYARARYMRGKAQLAAGHFEAAIAEAEAVQVFSKAAGERHYMSSALELRWLAAKESGHPMAEIWQAEMRAWHASVYFQIDYDALPDFPILPGETGFQEACPRLDLPDDLLAAVPDARSIVRAVAEGHFDAMLRAYRRNVLGNPI